MTSSTVLSKSNIIFEASKKENKENRLIVLSRVRRIPKERRDERRRERERERDREREEQQEQ